MYNLVMPIICYNHDSIKCRLCCRICRSIPWLYVLVLVGTFPNFFALIRWCLQYSLVVPVLVGTFRHFFALIRRCLLCPLRVRWRDISKQNLSRFSKDEAEPIKLQQSQQNIEW